MVKYLEVAIGPDAEVFCKSPVLSSVGQTLKIEVADSHSTWNNPEPRSCWVLKLPRGETVGAMLGNDVNLRDFEGRSVLLLSKGQGQLSPRCSRCGPFIRLFTDGSFTIDDVRSAKTSIC